MSDEQAAALERQYFEGINTDRRDGSAADDVDRAYNEFWWDRRKGVAIVDGRRLASLIVDPPDGRIPPLTPDGAGRAVARDEARKRRPADGPEDLDLSTRCLSLNAGPPLIVGGNRDHYVQLLQTRDHIVIHSEMIHDTRVVPLDGRAHLPSSIRLWMGDSIGHWEGETLVVDTTNFTDHTVVQDFRGWMNVKGSGENLHLIERFTRTGQDVLLYEFTVDDPTTFTRPWTAIVPLARTNERIFEYACHEGNYSLVNILRGARAQENGRLEKRP